MNLLVMAFSGVGRGYDPPCDPGFFCEVDDESIAGQLMLWIIILGVLAALFFVGIMNDSVATWFRKRRKSREPLASTTNRPAALDSRPSVGPQPNKVGKSFFNYRCQTCDSWVLVEDNEIDGKNPPRVCNRCSPTPTA